MGSLGSCLCFIWFYDTVSFYSLDVRGQADIALSHISQDADYIEEDG